MSRSRKKAIYKDNGMSTGEYWRPIRREWKQSLNKVPKNTDVTWWWYDWDIWEMLNSIELRNPKAIINDYDYCDYIVDYEYLGGYFSSWETIDPWRDKLSRK